MQDISYNLIFVTIIVQSHVQDIFYVASKNHGNMHDFQTHINAH
ncbi:hypothetical protein BVRB_9g220890 [Beta vulgaris subsp. vulgaris]|nr:hypothetical protein BVRB_9g220890 [Beta vulgaris subsp. vulgaris]